MSFLDRFKRKAPTATEPAPASETPGQGGKKKADPAAIKAAAQSVLAKYQKDVKAAPVRETRLAPPSLPPADMPGRSGDGHELTLELGDFLHRIPKALLAEGTHDVHHPLRFKIEEMADRISRGLTTIPLAEIYRQVPKIFRSEVRDSDGAQIRFPWQKVMILLNESRGGQKGSALSEAAARALAAKLKASRPPKNIVPIKQETAPLIPPPAATQALAPMPPPPPPPPPAPVVNTPSRIVPSPLAPVPQKSIPGPAVAPADTSVPQPAPAPASPDLASAAAEASDDDECLTREELIRSHQAATQNLARVKGEYERQLATARDERKALFDERDRIAADLEQAQKDLHDRQEQIEFEKSRAAKSADALQKLQEERATGGATAAASAVQEREIQELQGKLTEFEASVNLQATELAQAHERCSTLEEQLAVAEHARQEAVRRTDETTAALRQEFEDATRQRESEAAASLKHLQDQLDGAQAHSAKLAAEVEQSRRALTESSRQIEQRLRHENERTLGLARANLLRDLEDAKRQRESEISGALKQLQNKLQVANAEQARLAAELEKANATKSESVRAAESRLKQEQQQTIELVKAEMQREFDAARLKLEAEAAGGVRQILDRLKAATEEKAKLSTELEQAHAAKDETAKATAARFEHEIARASADAAEQAREKFEAERTARESEFAARIEQVETQLRTAEESRAKLAEELERSKLAITESTRATEERLAAETEHKLDDANAKLRADFETEKKQREAESAAALKQLQDQLNAATEARAKISAELEQAHAANDETAKATAARFEREIARASAEAAEQAREKFEAEQAAREKQFATRIGQVESQLRMVEEARAKLAGQLDRSKLAVTESARAMEERFAAETQRKLDDASTKLRADFETEKKQREAESAAALKQLQDQLNAATEARAKLSTELEQAHSAKHEAAKETAARFEREIARASAEAAEQAREKFEAERAARESEVAAQIAKVEAQLRTVEEARTSLAEELDRSKLAVTESARAMEERFAAETQRKLDDASAKLRADFETEKKQREAEGAAALKQLQDQLHAATEARAKLSTDLEQALAAKDQAAKETAARFEREIACASAEAAEQARKKFQAERAARETEVAAQIAKVEAQLQTVEQARTTLAEEFDRSKLALTESARAMEERFAAETQRKLDDASAKLRADFETEKKQREGENAEALKQLQDQLNAATEARAKLSTELEQARVAKDETAKATAARFEREIARASAEAAEQARERFEAERAGRETEVAAQIAKAESQLRTVEEARTTLAEELDRSKLALTESARAMEERFAAETQRKLDEASAKLRADFETEKKQREGENAQALKQLQDQLNAATEARAKLSTELEQAQAGGAQALRAAEERLTQETARKIEEVSTGLRAEFEAARQQREREVSATLQQLDAQLQSANDARGRLTSELERAQATAAAVEAEHAQKLERTVSGLRSEFDATLRQQQAEAAEQFRKSSERQLATVSDSLRKDLETAAQKREAELTRELDQLRSELQDAAEAHSTISADLHRSQAAHAALVAAGSEATALSNAFESRAVAQLEADIDTYRTRIKAFIKERDEAKTARDSAIAEAQSAGEKFAAERAALEEAKSAIEQRVAEAEHTTSDRLAHIRKLEGESAQRAREHQRALASQKSQHDTALHALRVEKDSALAATTTARDEAVAARAELEQQLAQSQQTGTDRQAHIEKLQAEVGRKTADLGERMAHIEKLDAEIARRAEEHQQAFTAQAAQHESALAALRTGTDAALAALAAEHQATLSAKAGIEQKLSESEQTAAARHTEIERLQGGISAGEEKIREKEQQIAQLEQRLEERSAQIKQLEADATRRADEQQQAFAAKLSEHEGVLVSLRAEKDAAIASLSAARDHVGTAKAEVEKRLAESDRLAAERFAQIEKLQSDVAAAQSHVREKEDEIARLTAERREALATLATAHEQAITRLASEREVSLADLARAKDAALAALTTERDDERKNRGATEQLLQAAENTARELGVRIQQLESDVAAARGEIEGREKEIAKLGATHHESLLAQNHQHQQALAALGAIRDALIGERDAAFDSRKQLEVQLAEARRLDGERLVRMDELEGFVANARAMIRQRDETIARVTEEHQQAVTAQTQRHDRAVHVLTTEKDAAIANLAAEKAALIAEHDNRLTHLVAQHEGALKQAATEKASALDALRGEMERGIAAIVAEKEKILAAKAQADARIGELAAERDDAQKDSAAVAQHLAAVTLEAEKRINELQAEAAELVGAKQKAQAELLEATETHKAQSAVFSREFNALVALRDKLLAELNTTRASTAEKEAELAHDRAALRKLELELSQQHEREMNRLRRERDSVMQQRDALRARFERVVEEQRELLSDLHSSGPVAPPPAPTRTPAESLKVIDITEAESQSAPEETLATGSGLRIPQARPISVPPPSVRVL